MDRCAQHDQHAEKLSSMDKQISVHDERINNMKGEQQEMKLHMMNMETKLDDLPNKLIEKMPTPTRQLSGKQLVSGFAVVMGLIEIIKALIGKM